jgi:hypothetical protein
MLADLETPGYASPHTREVEGDRKQRAPLVHALTGYHLDEKE